MVAAWWFCKCGLETPLLSTDASRWTRNHKEGRLTSSSRIDMQLGQQMIRAAPNRCCLAHRCSRLLRFSDQCASAVYAPELAKRVRRCQCSLEPGPFQASLNPSCFPSPNINRASVSHWPLWPPLSTTFIFSTCRWTAGLRPFHRCPLDLQSRPASRHD